MAYAATDFLAAFQQLLPRGAVWPREPSAVQTQALATLMPTYARLAARDANLLVDAFPATAQELLPEWESTLGLPDPCARSTPTLAQRQAHVVARLQGPGGQSIPYLVQFAATLGFTVTITEFSPLNAGNMVADGLAYGSDWAFAWQVNAKPASNLDVLICEFARIKPAHTVSIMSVST